VDPLLYYLPRGAKDYTDHALIHSYNLLELFLELTKNIGLSRLTEEERYAVCLAVFLHDLGCLIRRSKHNELSQEILNSDSFSLLEAKIGSDIMTCVRYLALSHSSSYDLSDLPNHPIHSRIRLDLICALFRLVDGCDLMPSRANKVLFETIMEFDRMGNQSQRIWKAHLNIRGVVFKGSQIIISSRNPTISDRLTSHLARDLGAINEVLRRHNFTQFSVVVKKVK